MTTSRSQHPQLGRKQAVPSLPERLLSRPNLVAKIEHEVGKEGTGGGTFLVSAPAGYGKTTLLAEWASQSIVPTVWYHLDAADRDPVTFVRGLVQSLRGRLPRATWQIEGLLRRIRTGILTPLDQQRVGDLLISDLRENVRRPLALILTGLGEIGDDSDTLAVLQRLLTRPSDRLRLILEARDIPRMRLSPLIVQRRLTGLSEGDLRLTEREVEALLALVGASDDPRYRAQLRQLCDGWITGFLLATGALIPDFLASYSVYASSADAFNRDAIYDYLAHEVIEALPQELVDFATRAAVMNYMTVPLCGELLGASDARECLVALERRTGLLARTGRRPEEPTYRFQPFLRQALLHRLYSQPDGAAAMRALHLRAGQLAEAAGDYEEAVLQYAEVDAHERILALIEAQRGHLLRAGHGATLRRWAELVPAPIRTQHPHLQVLLAELYRHSGRTAEALALAEQACSTIITEDAASHAGTRRDAADALRVRAALYYDLGRYDEGRRDSESALRIAPEDADEMHIEIHFTLAACLVFLTSAAEVAACLDALEERCRRVPDPWPLARLYYYRSKLALGQAAFRQAEELAEISLRYAEEADDELIAIACRLNLGGTRQYLGRPDAARRDLEEARVRAEMAGYAVGQVYADANLGELELYLDRLPQAVAAYERVLATEEHLTDLHLRACVRAQLGYALTLQGQVEEAEKQVDRLLAEAGDRLHGADWAQLVAVRGVAAFHDGRMAAAVPLLRAAARAAITHDTRDVLCRTRLYLAAIEMSKGRPLRAGALLRAALQIIKDAEGTPMMGLELRHLPELRRLLEREAHPARAALLARVRTVASTAEAAEEPNEDVRVYLLGNPRVLVGDQRILHWRRPIVRELLFFLLDQGKPVSRDTIVEALWPGRDIGEGEAAFRRARHFLKELLRRPCMEQIDGHWQLTMDCWVDVREFEHQVDAAEELATLGDLNGAAHRFRQALLLWGGDYLEDLFSDWAILRRDALRRRYLSCLEQLAETEMQLGQYERAGQLYYQILDLEPLRETAFRGLMRYFAVRGEYGEAISVYQRCMRTLADDLGSAPAPQTNELYQAIQARMKRVEVAQRAAVGQ
jgi:LuxR family maltose regulon positive regulatory protein